MCYFDDALLKVGYLLSIAFFFVTINALFVIGFQCFIFLATLFLMLFFQILCFNIEILIFFLIAFFLFSTFFYFYYLLFYILKLCLKSIIPMWIHYFLLKIHSMKWLKHTRHLFRKNLQIKDVLILECKAEHV